MNLRRVYAKAEKAAHEILPAGGFKAMVPANVNHMSRAHESVAREVPEVANEHNGAQFAMSMG